MPTAFGVLFEGPDRVFAVRPSHYRLITREWDHEVDTDTYVYLDEGFNDLSLVVGEDLRDAGVFDNWHGEWVVEPPWVDEVELLAEGFARYDLRSLDGAVRQ